MERKDCVIIILIFFVALTVGGGYLKFGPIFPVESDSISYNSLAQNLVKGKGYVLEEGKPTAVRAPGYPFFLALIYTLFGYNYDSVRIIQILILAGIGIVVYFAAKKHLKLSPAFALLASTLVVIWPYFVFYTGLLLTEILFTFFLILAVFFLLEFYQFFSRSSIVLSGLCLGIATLIRPEVLLLPFWLIFLWFFHKRKKEIIKKQLLIVLVFVLVLSPWTIRNFIQFHRFALVTAGEDENSTAYREALNRALIQYDYLPGVYLGPGEITLKSAIFYKLKNIYLFWNPGVEGKNARIILEKYDWAANVFLIYKILFFLILGAAFLSLKFIKRKEIFLLWAIIFYFWALHTVLYPYPRYTLPIIPLVILLAIVTFYRKTYSLPAGKIIKYQTVGSGL